MIPFDERPREACGLFGIHGHPDASKLTYFGLYALQHRGRESAGIAVCQDKTIVGHKGMGLVPDVFEMHHLEELRGLSAVGHVRYSTTGSSILSNAQPFVVHHSHKSYAVAHNGNLVNAHTLKKQLEGSGSILQTTMDNRPDLLGLELAVKGLEQNVAAGRTMPMLTLAGTYNFHDDEPFDAVSDELREAMRQLGYVGEAFGDEAGEGAVSIHDLVKVNEPGISKRLWYDAYERRSGLVHVMPIGTTAEAFEQASFKELGDFVSGAFEVTRAERDRVVL